MKKNHLRRMAATFSGMTPLAAGAHGYRTGYVRAYRYWRQWAERYVAQIRAERVQEEDAQGAA